MLTALQRFPPVLKKKKPGGFFFKLKRDRVFLAMIALPFLYYLIFMYLPMIGVVIAFKDYSVGKGIFGSAWVGFEWFVQFFESIHFWKLMRNTFLLSFYSLIFGFPVPIIFALFVNEIRIKSYKRIVQTVSYLPHFISVVIIVGIMTNFLEPHNGIVNNLIEALGGERINFLGRIKWFRFLFVSFVSQKNKN